MFRQAMNQHDIELRQGLLKRKIKWSNIPPKAPHFGGCWESGVKLVKNHLKRVLKEVRLNYEDFETLLLEIEATVNSHPLWYISTEIDELNVSTPGHFLSFRPINTLSEPRNSKLKMNRLSQYQCLHRLLDDFWKSWSKLQRIFTSIASTEKMANATIQSHIQSSCANLRGQFTTNPKG